MENCTDESLNKTSISMHPTTTFHLPPFLLQQRNTFKSSYNGQKISLCKLVSCCCLQTNYHTSFACPGSLPNLAALLTRQLPTYTVLEPSIVMSAPEELEPIAIVGIACRLPGDVRTPSELWSLVENKRSTFIPIPANRFNYEGFYHSHGPRQGSLNIPGGHFITSPSLSAFDASFFHIPAIEANSMDPQQRMLLEVTWECFESAGVKVEDLAGQNVGVYVGAWTCDYADMQLKEPDVERGLWITGAGRAILSNRISYVFDFMGPRCDTPSN